MEVRVEAVYATRHYAHIFNYNKSIKIIYQTYIYIHVYTGASDEIAVGRPKTCIDYGNK